MEAHKKLLMANQAWAKEKNEVQPDFFQKISQGQSPEFLWIGCSDSRVPAEEVTGAHPGEIFVHRNIANLFVHSDFNALSVLEYAVEFLRVKHIIVCGHYGCGGVRAALTTQNYYLLNKWLYFIKDAYLRNAVALDVLSEEEKWRRMVEINVEEQVLSIGRTSIIQRAWTNGQDITIHGWIFDLETGLLKTVTTMNSPKQIEPIFRFDF